MKLALFALNPEGLELAQRLKDKTGHQVEVSYCGGVRGRLKEACAEAYGRYDGLVFITAAGIAVRVLVPLISSKTKDPAVVVIDPLGRFVVSLLSGHLGGANRLARELAEALSATPVITTATDVLGRRPVEDWAAELDLAIINPGGLVKINSAIMREEPLTLYSALKPEFFAGVSLTAPTTFRPLNEAAKAAPLAPAPLRQSTWPDTVQSENGTAADGSPAQETRPEPGKGAALAVVHPREQSPIGADLLLVPRCLAVGVGCRRGIGADELGDFLAYILKERGYRLEAVKKLVSIEAKNEERGILELCRSIKISAQFYPAEELSRVLADRPDLNRSEFVKAHMGVDGVCEPAAILGSGGGQLVIGKTTRPGITLAVALAPLPWLDWVPAALST